MNYEMIKREYETTKTSFKKLSDRYKIHYKALERRAKKEGWIKFNPKAKATPPTITPPKHPNSQTKEVDTKTVLEDIKTLLKSKYKVVDDILIDIYIDSYIRYKQLKKKVKEEGEYLLSSKGNNYMNPKYAGVQMEKMNLIKIGKELGITISARVKLDLEQEEEKSGGIFDIVEQLHKLDDMDIDV